MSKTSLVCYILYLQRLHIAPNIYTTIVVACYFKSDHVYSLGLLTSELPFLARGSLNRSYRSYIYSPRLHIVHNPWANKITQTKHHSQYATQAPKPFNPSLNAITHDLFLKDPNVVLSLFLNPDDSSIRSADEVLLPNPPSVSNRYVFAPPIPAERISYSSLFAGFPLFLAAFCCFSNSSIV